MGERVVVTGAAGSAGSGSFQSARAAWRTTVMTLDGHDRKTCAR